MLELDEANTLVRFDGANATMVISVILPRIYESILITFEGAQSNAGVFDSEASTLNPFWRVSSGIDPCNLQIIGEFPVRFCVLHTLLFMDYNSSREGFEMFLLFHAVSAKYRWGACPRCFHFESALVSKPHC